MYKHDRLVRKTCYDVLFYVFTLASFVLMSAIIGIDKLETVDFWHEKILWAALWTWVLIVPITHLGFSWIKEIPDYQVNFSLHKKE